MPNYRIYRRIIVSVEGTVSPAQTDHREDNHGCSRNVEGRPASVDDEDERYTRGRTDEKLILSRLAEPWNDLAAGWLAQSTATSRSKTLEAGARPPLQPGN